MTPSGATLILTAVATSCVAVLLGMPRPIEPTELPALVVTRAETERFLAEDRRRARALGDEPTVRRVRALLDASARGEVRREAFGTADARRRAMDAAVGALLHARGPAAIHAIRARATLDALDALAHALPEPERVRRLGRFPETLARYGAYRDGKRLAPVAVVRVLFMGRVNAMLGRRPTDGLDEAGERIYWGWLALHAADAPIDQRLRALNRYGDLRGPSAAEAAGVLLFRVGQLRDASAAFEIVHARTGSIRARDHALAGLSL